MRSWRLFVLVAVPLASLIGCGEPPSDFETKTQAVNARHARVCSDLNNPDIAACTAHVIIDANGSPAASPSPTGYLPADLQAAYNLPSANAGAGQVIGIVDAYDYPTAEADLAVYRAAFGLPACGSANGCFRKVDQKGGTTYPKADVGWAQEAALDIQMASAICPNCKIILVEANSSSMADLGAAVNTAVALGATVVSNSWAGSESSRSLTYEQNFFNHPGVPLVASSGDDGYGVLFPASSRYVVAAGGTKLSRDSSAARGFAETAWIGAGSGCSKYFPKPAWQKDTGCSRRTVADVSAVADPATGVSVYDCYGLGNTSDCWLKFGGTSVSSPIIAACSPWPATAPRLPSRMPTPRTSTM
jgi:subtilase family serine protease